MSIPTTYAQTNISKSPSNPNARLQSSQNYLDLEKVGSSCRAQVGSPYDGLAESVFPLSWSQDSLPIETFDASLDDEAGLENLKQSVIATSANQVIHSWRSLEREIVGHDQAVVTHSNAHRNPLITSAMATSSRLLPQTSTSLESASAIGAELRGFNAIVKELNQTCTESHQDFAQLKKILGNKMLQDQQLHPEFASLIYPKGRPMIGDVASHVRARMKEVRTLGAIESSLRWNLLSETRVGKLIQIQTPLQNQVGHWHPLSCVEDGSQLKTLDVATVQRLKNASLQAVREKYQERLQQLQTHQNQEAGDVLQTYLTTAPHAISMALLAQPSKQRAQQVCALIVDLKEDAELKEELTAWAMPLLGMFSGGAAILATGSRGALAFSTIAAGLNGLWLFSSVTDLFTSVQTEKLLEQALVSGQIDPAQGKVLLQNIQASYPMSILNLALAGVGTAAMSLKISNITKLNSYKRYLDVQGGATSKAWGKVKSPTPPKTGGYSTHPSAQRMGVKFTQPQKPSGGELSAQQIDDLISWVNNPKNLPQVPRPSGGSGGTAVATKPVVTTRPAIVRESSTPSIKTPQNGVLIQPSMKSAPFVGEPIKNKIYPMIPIIPLSPPSLEGQAEKSIQELFTFPLVQTSVVQVSPYDITNSPGDPVHFDDLHHLYNQKNRMVEVQKILVNGAAFNPKYKWEICNLARTDSGFFGKAAREFLSKNPNITCPDLTGVAQDLIRRAIGYRNGLLEGSVSDSERKGFVSALAVLFDGQDETIGDVSYIKKLSKLNNDLGALARIWFETKFIGLNQSLKGKANEALIKNFGLLAFHNDERAGIQEWIEYLYFNGSEREKSLASKWFLYHRIQAPKPNGYLNNLSELLELQRASKAKESSPKDQKAEPVVRPSIVTNHPLNIKADKPKVTKLVPVVDSAEKNTQNRERLNEALAEARRYSVDEARQYFEVELKKDNEKFIEFKKFKEAINFRAFSGNQDEIYLLLYYIHKKSTRNCNTGKCNVEDADLELIRTYLKNKQNIGETKARRWPLRLVDVGVLGQDPDNSEPAKSPENNFTSRGDEFLQPVFNYLPIETQPGQRFFRPGILLFDPSKGPINLGEPLNHDEQIIFDQIRLSGLMYEKINQLPNESEKASRVTKVWNAQNGDTYYLKSDFSGQDHDWYNRVTNIEYAVYLTNKKLINRYPSAILIELQGKRIFVIKKVSNDMKVNYREVNGRTHAELSAENLNKAVTQDLWTHPKISSEIFIQLRDKGPFEIDLAEDIMLFDFLVANSDRAVDYNVSFPNHRKFNRIMSLDDLPIKLDDDYNGFLIYDGERSFEFDLSSRMDMEKEFQRYIRKYYYYSPEIKTAKDHVLEVLRKNPEFIEKLKKWDAMMIRNELNHYLNHSEIERLINNRQTILELVEQIKVQPVEIENLGNSILNTEENKMFLILKNSNLSYNEIESLPVSKEQYRMNTRLWRDGHGSEYYFVIEDPREIEYGLNHRIDPKREYAAYYVDQKFFNRYPPAILIQVDGKPVFVFKKVKNQLQFNLSLEGNKYEGLSVVQLRDIVIPYIHKNYVQGDKLYEMMVRGSVVDFDLPDDILISDMLIGFSERNLYQNTFFVNCGADKSQVDVNLNNLPYDISGLGCQIKVLDGRQAFVLKLDDRLGDQYKYWLANFLSRYSKSYHHHANAIRVVKDALQNNIERMRRISEWLPGEIKEELIPYISLSEINLLIQNRQRLLSLMATENPSFRDPLEAQKKLTTREQVLAVVDDKNPFQFQDDLILEMNLILKEKSNLSNRLEKWIQDHSDPHDRFIFSLKEHVMIPFVLNPKSSALETVAEYTAIQWIARYAQNNDPAKRQAQDWISQKKKNQIEVKNKLIEIIQGYQPGQPIIRTFDFENRKIQLTISDSMIQVTDIIGQLKFSFTVIIRDEINGKKILHNLELVKLNQNSMYHSIFSGDDLMDLSFQILSKIGVEVKTIESNWLPNPNQYLSRMYYAYVRGIEEGLIPTDAAKRTWISNQFLKHGYEVSHLNAPLDVVHSKEIVTVFYKKKVKALLSDPTIINLDNLPSTSQQDLVDQWNQGLVEPQLRDKIRAEIDPQFSTIRLFPAAGRLPKNAKARVFISHGLGVNTSSSKATAFMMEILGTLAKGKPRSTLSLIQQLPEYEPFAVEAIDLPKHGVNGEKKDFESLESVVDYLTKYLKQMKSETPDLPLYVVARSASSAFFTAVNVKNPGLIDALILMSPELPGRPDLESRQKTAMMNSLVSQGKIFNSENHAWYKKLTREIQWTSEYFGSTPVLIFTGSNDVELLDEEKKFYRDLASQNQNIKYYEIQGADHNVFDTRRPHVASGRLAYTLLYNFIHELNSIRNQSKESSNQQNKPKVKKIVNKNELNIFKNVTGNASPEQLSGSTEVDLYFSGLPTEADSNKKLINIPPVPYAIPGNLNPGDPQFAKYDNEPARHRISRELKYEIIFNANTYDPMFLDKFCNDYLNGGNRGRKAEKILGENVKLCGSRAAYSTSNQKQTDEEKKLLKDSIVLKNNVAVNVQEIYGIENSFDALKTLYEKLRPNVNQNKNEIQFVDQSFNQMDDVLEDNKNFFKNRVKFVLTKKIPNKRIINDLSWKPTIIISCPDVDKIKFHDYEMGPVGYSAHDMYHGVYKLKQFIYSDTNLNLNFNRDIDSITEAKRLFYEKIKSKVLFRGDEKLTLAFDSLWFFLTHEEQDVLKYFLSSHLGGFEFWSYSFIQKMNNNDWDNVIKLLRVNLTEEKNVEALKLKNSDFWKIILEIRSASKDLEKEMP